jgi:dTDP-4-dehydrorhamnose reductase
MELWGGIECTINRVQDLYMDQLTYSGHYNRNEDIEQIAGLGIKKLRYPVLWEKHKPEQNIPIDWSHTEARLLELKQRGVEPIAGLVHHGSGPAYVHMSDESFATGLAEYAGQVAEKFPWLTYYTPVNEPLTTARFCGLYGLWYPHGCDDRSFLRILYNECKATVLAMQEIRKVNPDAKLVQTEDLGKIHSTPLLQYQAKFENHRRWLSFDFLCGKVTSKHPLYLYIIKNGLTAAELNFFIENPCPPDVMGFNYYLTSERYLDQNTDHYPPHTHGSNGRHRYADVEVVRVGDRKPDGLYLLLKEAWERYGLPLAVTEMHLHCTREEQLRWIKYVWEAAEKLSNENVDIRGVTAWAILGSFGWNRLLTLPDGDYEAGVFDVLSGRPRSTAMATMLKGLAASSKYEHPVLQSKGWWERNTRVVYNHHNNISTESEDVPSAPVLIIGNAASLGNAFVQACQQRNITYKHLHKNELDIADSNQVKAAIEQFKPWAIINTDSFLELDQAEEYCNSCYRLNTDGPDNLAYFTSKYGIKLLTFSSDMVFDGQKNDYYLEHDRVSPLNTYGQSNALAEKCVLTNDPSALVIRTGTLFSALDHENYVVNLLNRLKNEQLVEVEDDVFISPTYVPDLVHTSLNLLIDNEAGIWHLANSGNISWAALAKEIAERAGHNVDFIRPVSSQSMDYKAVRPKYSALKSERGMLLPPLHEALNTFFLELKLIA